MFEKVVVVTVIIALGQFAKQYVPTKYIPSLTLGLGVIGELVSFITLT